MLAPFPDFFPGHLSAKRGQKEGPEGTLRMGVQGLLPGLAALGHHISGEFRPGWGPRAIQVCNAENMQIMDFRDFGRLPGDRALVSSQKSAYFLPPILYLGKKCCSPPVQFFLATSKIPLPGKGTQHATIGRAARMCAQCCGPRTGEKYFHKVPSGIASLERAPPCTFQPRQAAYQLTNLFLAGSWIPGLRA